jgi:hypothetical protein
MDVDTVQELAADAFLVVGDGCAQWYLRFVPGRGICRLIAYNQCMTLLGDFVRTSGQGEKRISWRSMSDMRSNSRAISYLMERGFSLLMLLSLLLFHTSRSFSTCLDISTKFPDRVMMTPPENFVWTSGQGQNGDRRNGKDLCVSFTLRWNRRCRENGVSASTPFL